MGGLMDEIRDLLSFGGGSEEDEKRPEDKDDEKDEPSKSAVAKDLETDVKNEEKDEDEVDDTKGKKGEEEEVVGKKDEKSDVLLAQIDALKSQIEDLKTKLEKADKGEKDVKGEKDEKGKEEEIIEFIKSDDELEEIVSSHEKFNQFLTKLVYKVKEDAVRELPDTAAQLVESRMQAARMVEGFYKDNPDLLPFRRYVGVEASRIQQEHPEWGLEKILKETESVVRKNLRLEKKAAEDDTKDDKPAFAAQKHGKKRVEKAVKGLKAEIKELLEGV